MTGSAFPGRRGAERGSQAWRAARARLDFRIVNRRVIDSSASAPYNDQ